MVVIPYGVPLKIYEGFNVKDGYSTIVHLVLFTNPITKLLIEITVKHLAIVPDTDSIEAHETFGGVLVEISD